MKTRGNNALDFFLVYCMGLLYNPVYSEYLILSKDKDFIHIAKQINMSIGNNKIRLCSPRIRKTKSKIYTKKKNVILDNDIKLKVEKVLYHLCNGGYNSRPKKTNKLIVYTNNLFGLDRGNVIGVKIVNVLKEMNYIMIKNKKLIYNLDVECCNDICNNKTLQ